jgi:hypothetical protein
MSTLRYLLLCIAIVSFMVLSAGATPPRSVAEHNDNPWVTGSDAHPGLNPGAPTCGQGARPSGHTIRGRRQTGRKFP